MKLKTAELSHEINERIRAEKWLKYSEERMRYIINQVPGMVYQYVQHPDGSFSMPFVSERFYEYSGYRPDEIMADPYLIFKRVYPDDIEIIKQAVYESASTLKNYHTEHRLITPDGEIKWFRVEAVPKLQDNGDIVWNGVSIDITERKQAEEKFSQIYMQLIEAQRFAKIGTWHFDVIKGEVVWSDQIYEICGLDPLCGPPSYEDHKKIFHPDDFPIFQKHVECALADGTPYSHELRVLRPDGSMRYMIGQGSSVKDKTGKVIRLFGIVQDITERKQAEEALRESEQRLRSILNATTAAVALLDKHGIVIDSNEVYAGRFKLKRNELIGQCIWDLFSPEVTRRRKKMVEDVFLTGKPIRAEDECNGMWNDFVIYPIYDNDRKVENVTVYAQDITNKKYAEQQIIHSDKMASLGLFSAGMAHEINNPVGLILLNIGMLKNIWKDFLPVLEDRAKQEPYKKYGGLKIDYIKEKLDVLIDDVNLAARRIESTVLNLKNFAKKSDIYHQEPIEINKAVHNALKLSQSTLKKSKIEIELDLYNKLPHINGNIQSFEQIIVNLIINAIQAHEGREGKIRIETEFQTKENKVVIWVADTGKGISSEIFEKIFDPFVTTRQAQGGIGLGLAIVYNLVKLYNGEISFQSQPGKGTMFKIAFPALFLTPPEQ